MSRNFKGNFNWTLEKGIQGWGLGGLTENRLRNQYTRLYACGPEFINSIQFCEVKGETPQVSPNRPNRGSSE